MRRKIKLIILASLLVGGVIICAIRWKAWFVTPPAPIWEGDTINVSFNTFANDSILSSLQKENLDFLILGDIHSSMTSDDFNTLAKRHPNIQFWAQLGDWMERPSFYHEQLMYHSVSGTLFETLPIIAIPGNHEYEKGIIKQLYDNWKHIFPNPHNGPRRFLGTTYMVDFPSFRLLAIDTDGLQLFSDYTQVNFWLKKSIREAESKFTIVLMHHPISSTADGRMNPMMWLTFNGTLSEADVVFSGHDHNYARWEEKYENSFWNKKNSTVFVTTNASNKNYPVKDKEFDCSLSQIPVYEYLSVTKDKISIKTYELQTGKLVDEVTIKK